MDDQAERNSPESTSEEPMIKMGDIWVPAHEAWAKMEIASEVTDVIERFNRNFPTLSTEASREVVPVVRQRLKDVQLRMPKGAPDTPDLASTANELLEKMSPEEVIEQIQNDFGDALTLRDLISLAGEAAYIRALTREAEEYQANAILPEQTAQIWNDMGRPAPGGGLWSIRKVEQIIQANQSS